MQGQAMVEDKSDLFITYRYATGMHVRREKKRMVRLASRKLRP